MSMHVRSIVALLCALGVAAAASAQTPSPAVAKPASPAAAPPAANGVTLPADYVIGPDDHLTVLFWREKDMSADVIVRPDGKITLPLLNELQAAGLTPEELRLKVTEEAKRFVEDPNATVVIRQINSRKVYITGQVEKTGPYPLSGPTTVLQLISMAGGLKEYADKKNIVIMRTENGKPVSYKFNYRDVLERKNLKQNIELRPGDTVIVP